MLKSDKGLILALVLCVGVGNAAIEIIGSKDLRVWYVMFFVLFAFGACYITTSSGRAVLESQTSTFEAAVVWLFAWVLIPIDIAVWLFRLPSRFGQWLDEKFEDFIESMG